jgi:hypothetical protein
MKQNMQQKKKQHAKQKTAQSVVVQKFNWRKFCGKIALLFTIVVAVVAFTDSKEYFKADQTNNHVDRKWKSYYNFTKNKNVDVLLCGNSHIITGIDPFILSMATGCNCFILGAPSTGICDVYFTLGEALKHTQPNLVVIETYAIGGGEEKDNGSMYQIMSFEAHKDFFYKLRMMPALFNSDSWVKAWSPSIRNHSFLLTNREQIKFNTENRYRKPIRDKLDLGRFARFGEGLQNDVLVKYDSIGAPVDGSAYYVSGQSRKYLKKIMNLCEKKHIPVLFLTIPMYHKHISHYEQWKTVLSEELKKYPAAQWIDWQMPYDSTCFTPEAFENTYEANQHLSNYGMSVAAYKLAGFLTDRNPYNLSDRSKEPVWIDDFKSQPYFIFNQSLPPNMPGYYPVTHSKQIGGLRVKELLVQQNKDHNNIILKLENHPHLPPSVNAVLKIQYQDQTILAPLQMSSPGNINPPHHKVYLASVKSDVKVLDIADIAAVELNNQP